MEFHNNRQRRRRSIEYQQTCIHQNNFPHVYIGTRVYMEERTTGEEEDQAFLKFSSPRKAIFKTVNSRLETALDGASRHVCLFDLP